MSTLICSGCRALATIALMIAMSASVVMAQTSNTTIQEGKININHTSQCDESTDNATYQSGMVNINHTRQGCHGRATQGNQGRGSQVSESSRQRGRQRGQSQ